MNDWQRTFLQKLETAKKQWLHKFERFAEDTVEPAFAVFEDFTAGNGFRVTASPCEPGTRIYKFAVTENGYVMITFRMHGLEEVEASSAMFVPGLGGREPTVRRTTLCEATSAWVEAEFQSGLDGFVDLFGEAGTAAAPPDDLLVPA
jgi:hypothetical protein